MDPIYNFQIPDPPSSCDCVPVKRHPPERTVFSIKGFGYIRAMSSFRIEIIAVCNEDGGGDIL